MKTAMQLLEDLIYCEGEDWHRSGLNIACELAATLLNDEQVKELIERLEYRFKRGF